MARIELQDSRRLTGANLLSDHPGAIVDVSIEGVAPTEVVSVWRTHARSVLDAVGWQAESLHSRLFEGGASLAFSAPIDALYAATEVNEWALEATRATLAGEPVDLAGSLERLESEIAAEANPVLLHLRDAAAEHGVMFLSDDDRVSVGMGKGSISWAVAELPSPEAVPWDEVHDVPVLMVTGSNGKTTTVRMLAAMARACGYLAGYTCTDGVFVGDETVDAGDYSGPGGARMLIRDRRVEFAVVETARGGMLRRGLGIPRADAAIVTNVCDDHLGEWGAHSLSDLVETKLVIARAVADGTLVVNLDDEELAARATALQRPVTWISRDPESARIVEHVRDGGAACVISEQGNAAFLSLGQAEDIVDIERVPITVGGAAGYNVYNTLGAIALARSVGLPTDGIRPALLAFGAEPGQNRGRTNLYRFGGLQVMVDFAHNPHGVRALAEMGGEIDAARTMIMIGQAGDRDDRSIRDLARATWEMRPDLIVVKEMPKYQRGREDGEITGIILDELAALGVPTESIRHTDSEIEAVRLGFEWSEPGDFLVLPTQAERDDVIRMVETLRDSGWEPGTPLPPEIVAKGGATD